jgi:CheY-like chemotaxis protein
MNNQQDKIVFLIDDDPITNFIHTKIINADLPYTVIAFTDAEKALEEIKRRQALGADSIPDLILLDVNMPNMDGWEFLDEFQKLQNSELEKCGVIMLSSSLDRDDMERASAYKCVIEFISKPLTAQMLKDIYIPVEAR